MERKEELQSLIDQIGVRLEKAEAGGAEREANTLRKELKKLEKELEEILMEENSCSCAG